MKTEGLMTKHLLAGVAPIVLMSGVASADNYPPAPSSSMPLAGFCHGNKQGLERGRG
jgi:hypothetical protein